MSENVQNNITIRQQKAIQALLTCRTRGEAAEQAGISHKTLQRYLEDPNFIAEYKRAAAQTLDAATRSLQRGVLDATERLHKIVIDDKASASAQIAASRALCEFALRFTEFNDILKELEGETDVL